MQLSKHKTIHKKGVSFIVYRLHTNKQSKEVKVPDIEKDREIKILRTAQHKYFLVEVWITNKVNTEKIKLKKNL